jgi:MT-A70
MSKLALDALYKMTGHLKFSVIMMDPPWKDTGVKKLGYPTMGYKDWMKIIDFDSLQDSGYVFIWVANTKLWAAM